MISSSYATSLGYSKLTEIYPPEIVSGMNFGSFVSVSDRYLIIGTNNDELHIYSKLSLPYTYLFSLANQDPNIVKFCKKIEIYYDTFVIVNEDNQGQQVLDVYKIYSNEVKRELTVVGYFDKGYTSSFGSDISIHANNLLISDYSVNKAYWMTILNKDSIREIKPIPSDVINFGKNCLFNGDQIIISGEVNGSKKHFFFTKDKNNFILNYTVNSMEGDQAFEQSMLKFSNNLLYAVNTPKNKGYSMQASVEIFSKNHSLYFNGRDSYLEIESDYYLKHDFTAEAWVKIDDYLNKTCILGYRKDSNENNYILGISDSKLYFQSKDINGLTGLTELKRGYWYHIAVTRKQNVVRLFVNGQLDIQSESLYVNPIQMKTIGGLSKLAYLVKGNISNLRVLDGVCLYDTNFQIPKNPLQNIPNTVLLIGNNRNMIDNSNTLSVSVYGTVLHSEVPPDNLLWAPYDILKIDDYTDNVISVDNNVIAVGYPNTDFNGNESGSVMLYSNRNKNSFEKKELIYISPPSSHGGKYCRLHNNLLFLSAVDEEIDGVNNVGKVYVFELR